MLEYWGKTITTHSIAAVGALGWLAGWLVRTVLINQKTVEMLKQEIAMRDKRRGEDQNRLGELVQEIRNLRTHIIEIFKT